MTLSVRSLFTTLLVSCLYVSSVAQNKDYSDAIQLIEVWLEAQKDFEQLPGISAAIIKDQELVWSGAYGMANPAGNVPATPGTLYSICSISKLFTSIAIMRLYDDGKLRLDDKIEDLLPWYDLEQSFDDSGPITVRRLLTHSAGLPREGNFPYWSKVDFPSIEAIREELKNQETLYPSSTYFQYSNLGLTLLGEIVKERSGMSYDQYVQKNILDPLGLSNTRTVLPESLHGTELAVGYGALKRDQTRSVRDIFQAEGIKAAAGFSSNVTDLGKFASWQFRLREEGSDKEILQRSTLRNMHNVHWTDPDWETTWGLGFSVRKGPRNKTWVGHGGYCPGYQTTVQLELAGKMAYSVMINANGVNPGKYVRGMHGILNKKAPKLKDPVESSGKDLSSLVGSYMGRDRESYISTWRDGLVMMPLPIERPDSRMEFYVNTEGDNFRAIRDDGNLGTKMRFERDAQGNVIRAVVHDQFFLERVR